MSKDRVAQEKEIVKMFDNWVVLPDEMNINSFARFQDVTHTSYEVAYVICALADTEEEAYAIWEEGYSETSELDIERVAVKLWLEQDEEVVFMHENSPGESHYLYWGMGKIEVTPEQIAGAYERMI